jgi:Flp pilus assembly protein TadD
MHAQSFSRSRRIAVAIGSRYEASTMAPWLLLLAIALIWFFIFGGSDRLRARLDAKSPKPDAIATKRDVFPPVPDDAGPQPTIAVTGWGDVLLEYAPMHMVLIVLPKRDASAIEALPKAEAASAVITTMIVLNRPGPGYLFGSTIRERLGIDANSVFAVDPDAPIDRTPDSLAQTQKAAGIGGGLQREQLRLEATTHGAVLASWSSPEGPYRVLVGAGIPMSSLERGPHPHQVFGSMAQRLEGLPAVARAIAWTGKVRKVTLLSDVPPDTTEHVVTAWTAMGVDVTMFDRDQPEPEQDDWTEGAVALLEALAGDDDRLHRAVEGRTLAEVERALQSLTTIGRLADAERLAAVGLELLAPKSGLWFWRGVAAFMGGDTALALRSYRAAVAADPPYPEAWCNLAWMLASEGELDEALHAAEQAIAALPNDLFSVQAGVLIRQQRGDVSGAREFLRAHRSALEPSLYSRLTDALDDPSPRARAVIHRFPKAAELLVELGRSYREEGQLERALEPLRRAVALDPCSDVAAAELEALLEQQREAHARRG